MIYRVTFGFSGMGVGWSETHAMANASSDPGTLAPTLTDVAQKRSQMLGREFAIVAIRVSRFATEAGMRQRGVKLIKGGWSNTVKTELYAAEPASVAYLVRGDSAASPFNPEFDSNENQTFLGGPIDNTVDNGGVVYPGRSGLQTSFNSWEQAVRAAGMGWIASKTIKNVNIEDIAVQPNGRILFTFDPLALAGLTVGEVYKVRVRRGNAGVSPVNGEMQVRVKTFSSAESVQVIGIGYLQSGGAMRFYQPVGPFVPYGSLFLAERAARHSRGRPFGSTPGRARKRIRG